MGMSRHYLGLAYQPSNLLDKTTLKDVSEPLTSYAPDLIMRKWQETKKLSNSIENLDANEPPTRYGLTV
jgi:hypothetical protein